MKNKKKIICLIILFIGVFLTTSTSFSFYVIDDKSQTNVEISNDLIEVKKSNILTYNQVEEYFMYSNNVITSDKALFSFGFNNYNFYNDNNKEKTFLLVELIIKNTSLFNYCTNCFLSNENLINLYNSNGEYLPKLFKHSYVLVENGNKVSYSSLSIDGTSTIKMRIPLHENASVNDYYIYKLSTLPFDSKTVWKFYLSIDFDFINTNIGFSNRFPVNALFKENLIINFYTEVLI